jgi:hypothetical protein
MVRKAASVILMTVFLCLGLTPLVTPAQIPVTDVAHIAINQMGWTATLTQWVSQLSYMLQQYQQLVQTYQWAQHVAETLHNPDLFTVLSLFAIVDSATLTKIDSVSDFRRMVEGSSSYGSNLGHMYERIYGTALDLGHMAPRGPEDWGAAAGRMNTMVQNADAAVLETYALVSQVNKSLSDINGAGGTYSQLRSQIQNPGATPHQTAQANAMGSLYAAQSVDKNTQVLAAMAAMQAQQMAQDEAYAKRAIQDNQKENDYIQGCIQYLQSHPYNPSPWN